MSYENTLGEQSLQLAMAVANSGKEIRHINLALLNELVNELKCGKNNDGVVTALSDSAIEQLRTVLQTVSSQTFNQAVPMIKNIMEKLNSVVNPDIPVAYSQYDCVPIIFGDLWDTQLVTEMVEYGKTTAPDATSFAGMIKSVDDEAFADLVALTETGLGQFDDQVRALMGQFDEAQIRSLFNYAVLDGALPALNPVSNMIDSANGLLGFNAWLLLALWARRLHTMAPTSSDMSLSRYQACCLNLEKQAHAAMASIAEHRRSHAEAGRLIVKAEQNKVYVLNDLYVTYLAEGGTVEAIMGVITSRDKFGQSISLIKDIKESQANLETAWARHIQASKLASGQQSNALARRQFAVIMEETAKWHYGDDEGKVLPVNQGAYASAMDRIEEVMNKLPSDFVKDCHTHVFDAVAYVFYPKSDVARLLGNLREVGDIKDSGLSAEEIRVIANLHFVGDWLADIIALGDHGHGTLQYTNELFPVSIANKQDGEMGLEALNWADAAKIGAGLAILAIVGFGVYKLITAMNKKGDVAQKGSETIETATKAIDGKEKDLTDLEKAIKDAIDESIPDAAPELKALFEEAIKVGLEVPPSLEEQPEVVEVTPVVVKGNLDEVNVTSQEAVKTEVPVEPQVISPVAQSTSENKGKVWKGTAENVVDFLGKKEQLPAGVLKVLLGGKDNFEPFSEVTKSVEEFTDSMDEGALGFYGKDNLVSEIQRLKEDYSAKGDKSVKDIEKLVSEFDKELNFDIVHSFNQFSKLMDNIVKHGNGSHGLTTFTMGDIPRMLEANEGEFNSLEATVKQALDNMERNSKLHLNSIVKDKEQLTVFDYVANGAFSPASRVGEGIKYSANLIKNMEIGKRLEDTKKKLQGLIDKTQGDQEELKEVTEGMRWAFDKVERDPRQVNRLLEASKSLRDANAKMLELGIDVLVTRMESVFGAQKVYMRCLKAVEKHNEARKRGYMALVKNGNRE